MSFDIFLRCFKWLEIILKIKGVYYVHMSRLMVINQLLLSLSVLDLGLYYLRIILLGNYIIYTFFVIMVGLLVFVITIGL